MRVGGWGGAVRCWVGVWVVGCVWCESGKACWTVWREEARETRYGARSGFEVHVTKRNCVIKARAHGPLCWACALGSVWRRGVCRVCLLNLFVVFCFPFRWCVDGFCGGKIFLGGRKVRAREDRFIFRYVVARGAVRGRRWWRRWRNAWGRLFCD